MVVTSIRQPQLYDLDSRGCWIIDSESELKLISNLQDSAWIRFYNSGLRKIFTSEKLIENQISNFDFKKINSNIEGLNYLIQNSEDLKSEDSKSDIVKFIILNEKNIKALKNEIEDQKIHSSRRQFFRSFRPQGLINNPTVSNIENEFLPHSITINKKTCSACDACVKICPTQALKIEKENSDASYSLDPQQCDACALCESVCLSNSIEVTDFNSDFEKILHITENICSHCGHTFHFNPLNEETLKRFPDLLELCTVCQSYKHIKGSLRITQ